MTLTFLKSTGELFSRCPLNLDMSDLFSWSESGYAFLVGMAPKEVESSVDHIRRHMTSFYPRTDDVHFDHLVRWRHFIPVLVTSTLITWSGDVVLSQYWWRPLWSVGPSLESYCFPFLVIKYLMGRYPETILLCLRPSPSFLHSLRILVRVSFSNDHKLVVGEPLV